MVDCRFELVSDGAGDYRVRLRVDGEEPCEAPFDFNLFTEGRLFDIIASLESASVDKADIQDVGTQLWNALRPEPIRNRLEALDDPYQITLKIPDDFEINRLPWESIRDETTKRYLSCDRRRALTRVIAERGFTPNDAPSAGPIRMLVIVPRGSNLATGSEISNLQQLPLRVGADRLVVKPLTGRVTASDIADKVREEPWDIVHFIGHSRFKRETGVEIRLNADDEGAKDEQWPDANQFAELLAGSSIRLAVFNSCESGASATSNLSGLGQQVSIVAGIPAVVVMRYRIEDPDAVRFSGEFYRELFSPANPGRVDVAMQAARQSLYTNARAEYAKSFITPVLHLAPGCAQIFHESRMAALAQTTGIIETPDPERKVDLPKDLIERLRKGICLPVVGAGVHPAASRLGTDTPTLLQILNRFAECYPDRNELTVAENVAEFTSVLFPRVFQHFESANDEDGTGREKLILALQTCYSTTLPSTLRRIATWNVPGIIYTEIDGLMEEALRAAGRARQVVNIADRRRAEDAETPRVQSVLTLFNLRGTLADVESLILTDTDHDALLHIRLEHAIPDVSNLFKKALGRSVLFIGVSPLDSAVRRLARLFLESPRKVEGPRYFVVPHVSAGDRAYWRDLDVKWIEAEPSVVIETIDAAMKET
jgi:hypothetical protein